MLIFFELHFNHYNINHFSLCHACNAGFNRLLLHGICGQFSLIIKRYVNNYFHIKSGTTFNMFTACKHCISTVFTVFPSFSGRNSGMLAKSGDGTINPCLERVFKFLFPCFYLLISTNLCILHNFLFILQCSLQ